MIQLDFEKIAGHVSHHVVAVTYGDPPINAAIECETCGVVLYSAEPPMPKATQAKMWQFTVVAGGTITQQVLAGEELEVEIQRLAIVETARVFGMALADLPSDEDDAWAELVEVARENPYYSVSLSLVEVLKLEVREPRSSPRTP